MHRVLFCLFFLVFACGPSKKAQQASNSSNSQPVALPTLLDTTTHARQPTYHASVTMDFELIHTRLELNIDWDNTQVLGLATLTCRPKFYPQNVLILDAKGMLIHEVTTNDKGLNYEYDGNKLKVFLDKSYLKSDSLVLSVKYTAQPDKRPAGGSQAIAGDRGLYFINPLGDIKGKMPQIWTQGETESNSVWFPTIDAPNQKTSQDLFITVDRKFATLSNGVLVKSTVLPENKRTDHWQQKLPHAPYLTMLGVGEFVVVKNEWQRSNGSIIPVHYYVEPDWKNEAQKIFGNTAEMLTYFSKIIGFEYPWDKYHQIVVRDFVSGAMENTGAVVFSDMLYSTEGDLIDQNWDDIIAHELSHHWFGDLVTCESWSNLPMNESFATYFEVLWDAYKNGQDRADYHLNSDRQTYFKAVQNNTPHHNLIWFDYNDKEAMFDSHSYSKGACVLHMLRKTIGDAAFFEGIQHYINKHQYSTVEAHDLRLSFEAVTGMDLNWFFNQWFFAKGHPVLDIQHRVTPDSLHIYVAQKQDLNNFPLYRLPTNISVWDKNGLLTYPMLIENERDTFKFVLRDSLLNYLVDPDHALLAEFAYAKPDSFLIHQFNNARHFLSLKNALSVLAKKEPIKYADLILSGLEDAFFDVQLEAIDQCNRIKKTHQKEITEALMNLAKQDENPQVRLSALGFLFENFPNTEGLKASCVDMLNTDLSNKCKAKALYILGELDQQIGLSYCLKFENDKSSTLLEAVCEFYASYGTGSNFGFFKTIMQGGYLKGQERMMAMVCLGQFLARNKTSELRSSSFDLLKDFHNKGGYEQRVYLYVLDQLLIQMNQELQTINEEIVAYETAKDFVWAQRLEQEKKALVELIAKYSGR